MVLNCAEFVECIYTYVVRRRRQQHAWDIVDEVRRWVLVLVFGLGLDFGLGLSLDLGLSPGSWV